MPKLSKETASGGSDYDRGGELEGYHVDFMLVREDVDSTPLLKVAVVTAPAGAVVPGTARV